MSLHICRVCHSLNRPLHVCVSPYCQENVLWREAELLKQAAENERLREALRVQQVACEDLKTSIAQAELTCGLFPRACV